MKYIGILLVLLAVASHSGGLIQGYDGVATPGAYITLWCTAVDSFGEPATTLEHCDSVWGWCIGDNNTKVDSAKFTMDSLANHGAGNALLTFRWRFAAPATAGSYVVFLKAYGIGTNDARDGAGIITFESRHRDDYIVTMYAQQDSTLFFLQDSMSTAALIATAVEDTMSAHANTYKADPQEIADSVWADAKGDAVYDTVIAYLDESIAGIDDNPWDAGTRSLTEKTGFALTDAQHAAIEDTIHAQTADYKATGFSSHNAAAIWSDASGVTASSLLVATMDTLELWDDNIAHLNADISSRSSHSAQNVWDAAGGVAMIDSLVIIIDSLYAVLDSVQAHLPAYGEGMPYKAQ